MTEDPIIKRHQLIAGLLAVQLDNMFRAARTHDGKQLTDGEVMSALGVLIGGHVKSTEGITIWISAIQLSASIAHNARERTK